MTESSVAQKAVEAERLGKRFGRHWALAHVELKVEKGQTLLLAGPNGSGKTTLLRLVAGLHRPTRGSIRVFGHDSVKDRLACRRLLAVVSHHSYLYDRLTALEMVRVWARLLGITSGDADLRELLAEVGLAERSGVPVAGFSAGMRKRLTLLQARLKDPELVLFDEPFSALDMQGQRLVEEWITGFHQAGKTVLIASHDLERAVQISRQAILLEAGQIVWNGPADRLMERMEGGA
jgi:heme exporter protein A